MPKVKTSRKQLFRAALAITGQTAAEWAEANDLTAQHVSHVLNGRRESMRLIGKIDEFVAKHIGNRTTALAS